MLPFDTLVLNKYRILRSPNRRDGLLGKGTFGNVYLAHEELADRDVAIKQLGLESADLEEQQEEALRRFLTEGRLGLRVRHPNILEVHAIEPYEEGYLLVMELAESGDLKGLLSKGRPELSRSIGIAQGIASGLQAAHERGIVHRDLKPGNVFLMQDGTPKVADFGVAHIPQAVGGYLTMTRTGFQPGTVIYMSPEQAYGRRVDHRSDLYSLAVMLFELLSGTFYVDMQKCRELAQSQSTTTPALEELKFFQAFMDLAFSGQLMKPSARNPTIPPWLDAVVMRGLARDPDDRWQSGAEFAAALRAGPVPADAPHQTYRAIDATMIEPLTPASLGRRRPPPAPPPPAASTPSAPSLPPADLVPPSVPASRRDQSPTRTYIVPSTGGQPQAAAPSAEAVYIKPPPNGSRLSGSRVPADPDATYVGPSALRDPDATYVGTAAPLDPDATYVSRPAPLSGNGNGRAAASQGGERALRNPAAASGLEAATLGEVGTQRFARQTPAVAVSAGGAAEMPTQVQPALDRGQGGRKVPLWLLIGAPVAALAVAGGVAAMALSSGSKPKPSVPPVVAQTVAATATLAPSASPIVVVPGASASAAPSASPSASPTPAPKLAAQVTDAELLSAHPGAISVDRQNIAGTNGDLGQIALISQVAGGSSGCPRSYFDLFHADASGTWVSVWDGAKLPSADKPLLPDASRTDAGCYPDVKQQVRLLNDGGKPVTMLSAAYPDGERVVVLQWDASKKQVATLYDRISSVPGTQFGFIDGPSAGFHLASNAYPPPSSGLNPSYDRPTGSFTEDVVYQGDNFTATNQRVAPYCLAGKLAAKSATALLIGCPDGSPGGLSAAALTGDTSFADGITADDLQAGDDVTLVLADASLAPPDALNALPAATSVKSPSALARKQAAQRQAQPVRTVAPSSQTPPRTTQPAPQQPISTAPQPVQPAPQPVQPAPQPVQPVPQPPPSSGGGAGLGGGSGGTTGSGGAGLGGGGGSSTGGGGAGLGGGH